MTAPTPPGWYPDPSGSGRQMYWDGGAPYMIAEAQGEFIIVTLSVQNIGDVPQSYFGDNQKLIDTAGRQYGADSEASLWMNVQRRRFGAVVAVTPAGASPS